ncbi:peptidase M28 [Brevundimonas sp. GN22]
MPKSFLRGVALAALVFVSAPAFAQDFEAQRLSDSIRLISADDFQGRKPGTIGEEKTLAWLQAQYEAMGMKPGGRDGQWLQQIDLLRLTPKADAVVSVSSAGGAATSIAPADGLTVRAINTAGLADVANAPVVFAGYGITAPEREWDDYGDTDVTGKVVVVMSGSPSFGSEYRRFYAQEAYKADEAFRRGAVAIITVQSDFARSLSRAGRQQTLSPGSAELQFKGQLSAELAKSWGIGTVAEEALDAGAFKARALPLTLSVKAEETKDILVTHNLLARLEGNEFPDETIVFSAHWDHVGTNDHPGDNVFNGAWDNASGTVGVVEMAREFAKAGPSKRSVVFLHATAEEMGLLGAYGYAADPIYPLATTVADINIDMLPLSGPTRDVPIFGKGQNTLEDMLDVLAKAEGRYVSDDGQPEQGFYYRSDHFPFARAGVPALMPWHGVDFVDGGIEAGKAAWQERFARVYHKPTDEWSEDLDFTSAVENLTLLYRLGRELADSRVWPTWKPESEFGQVRARTDAERADPR